MTTTAPETPVPRLRPDLVIRPVGDDGRHTVKDLRSGAYFTLGPEEAFLLSRLDGVTNPAAVCAAFGERFGEELTGADLSDFLALAGAQRLIVDECGRRDDDLLRALRSWPIPGVGPEPEPQADRPRRSVLFLRVKLFDPSRLFDRLEPRLRFVWSRGFLAASAVLIAAAGLTAWVERDGFVSRLSDGWGWRTAALAWLALAATTALHEFAHGLTCKHFGGEVRDVGFLLMYFMPCFYCNVSDAWLFPERGRRLWVTLAGGYCDLILWSLGVLAWRAALPGTAGHDFAWLVASLCGVRVLLNVNPLIPLDGYYVLSDLVGLHNLRPRALDLFQGWVRRVLWGAERPSGGGRGGLLLAYGLASWVFSLVFLTLTAAGASLYLGSRSPALGLGCAAVLGGLGARGLFRDFCKGEVRAMIGRRRGRAAAWVLAVGSVVLVLAAVPIRDRAGGSFLVRPALRAEVRAPAAGFLRDVAADEGGRVSAGQRVARLEVPDLESRLAQKRAERRESEAKLRLLEVGPRPEEVAEQRRRVDRARVWHDQARRDLERAQAALKGEVAEIDGQVRQFRAEVDRASETLRRDRALLARQALQLDQLRETEKAWKVATAQLDQAESRRRAREAEGALKAESELARRATEAAEAESVLRLLEAGSRPEEVEAEKARLARIAAEVRSLEDVRDRLDVYSPVGGVVATPRLRERVGRYLQEGELIAEVEAPGRVEAEVALTEQDVARVGPGRPVVLKARALPFRTFKGRVSRVASAAVRAYEHDPADALHTFIVYCDLDADAAGALKTGMTGYARVMLDPTPLGEFAAVRALRLIRTELWW